MARENYGGLTVSKIHRETPPGFFRRHGPKGRIVFEPDEITKTIHHLVLKSNRLENVRFPDQFDCIRPHLSNRFFLKLDLRNAFDSVKEFDAEVMLDLHFGLDAKYFFHQHGGLIQGAPASPILFNLYCKEILDKPLVRYCRKSRITYTRYFDDLLFSSQGYTGWLKARSRGIRDIIKKSGLRINEKKTILVDNKYIPIKYLGVRMHNGKSQPTEEFLQKLSRAQVGSEEYHGLLGWNRRVLALNIPDG
ncbi:MAG: Retron-type reverse transcriptase [Candidatus Giovannonibacteria bacterium GW2011_GWA1_44_25]|uniref:Retron-type reverse transcriptase n=1 Tax=Candidatus Giovannonibacteria bacterium GW2011_GWA1_44_25 TaxID=1618645 RepID=A0A0G1LFI7_9BACT|nr:MAG: Retron-type reverse transcriptase [Candidatus Giovannonibacteria bacterium GW2011_GWA1_44_25]